MERPYMDCKGKWKKIKAMGMKKGDFFICAALWVLCIVCLFPLN